MTERLEGVPPIVLLHSCATVYFFSIAGWESFNIILFLYNTSLTDSFGLLL